jgi:hypothetical protein
MGDPLATEQYTPGRAPTHTCYQQHLTRQNADGLTERGASLSS